VAALPSFLQQLAKSCADDGFVRLTLSSPTKTDEPVQRIVGKLIELKGQRHLSFTLREQRRDTTQNVPFPEALAFVEQKLRRDYRAAMLATTSADWQLQLGDGDCKLIRHKPSTKAPPQRAHDANNGPCSAVPPSRGYSGSGSSAPTARRGRISRTSCSSSSATRRSCRTSRATPTSTSPRTQRNR
jgi:hypothetical protein